MAEIALLYFVAPIFTGVVAGVIVQAITYKLQNRNKRYKRRH
jgi:phosphate/sulfate permease